MESSKSSERLAFPGMAKRPRRLDDRGRLRGHRGGLITMHRALARFVLDPKDLITASLLVLVFSFAWIASLRWLCRMWAYMLRYGMKALALHTELGLQEYRITSYIRFVVPFPKMESIPPTPSIWWCMTAMICLLFSASYFLPKQLTPVTYLLRAVLFIQGTAQLYFLLMPSSFPHTADSYMEGLVSYGIALISMVPALFGLIYYIFKFSLIEKIALTAMTMVHLSLFLPLQILIQAMVLQKSVLFMPILYIVFGLPVDILIVLGFYSWGMSWSLGEPRPK